MTDLERAALLLCPLCGEEAVVMEPTDGSWPWIECRGCGCCGPTRIKPALAAQAWNRRAALPPVEGWAMVPLTISEAEADCLVMPVKFYEKAVKFGRGFAPPPNAAQRTPCGTSAEVTSPGLAERPDSPNRIGPHEGSDPWQTPTSTQSAAAAPVEPPEMQMFITPYNRIALALRMHANCLAAKVRTLAIEVGNLRGSYNHVKEKLACELNTDYEWCRTKNGPHRTLEWYAREAVERLRALSAQAEGLRGDTELLNWCEKQWTSGLHIETCGASPGGNAEPRKTATVYLGSREYRAPTVRQALRAAKEGKQT